MSGYRVRVVGALVVAVVVAVIVSMTAFRAGPEQAAPKAAPFDARANVPAGVELAAGPRDDGACAAAVIRSPWEPRPENAVANTTVPPGPVESLSWGSPRADRLLDGVTGDFTGTTDEIVQWASCKWGFAPDITRAQLVRETGWRQAAVGDGGESFGLLQIRSTVWTGTYPWSHRSSAYNLDWSLGLRRACVEGYLPGTGGRGDLWGCIGLHFSGIWDDPTSREYAQAVRRSLATRPWEAWPSPSGGEPPPAEPR